MNALEGRTAIAICICLLVSRMAVAGPRKSLPRGGEPAKSAGPKTEQGRACQECVVLIHGLWRTSLVMKPLEWFLARRGYRVVNVTLPTLRCTVQEMADEHLQNAITSRITENAARIHFVTHSLGGIVARQYLSNHRLANLGRVVMLAPPNDGSPIVDRFKRFAAGRFFLGRGGRQLGAGPDDAPRRLGPVNFETGVIAGDRSLNPIFGWMLHGPNNGTVSVESTKVAGMKDFVIVHSTHTFIMWRAGTFQQVLKFLETGRFYRDQG